MKDQRGMLYVHHSGSRDIYCNLAIEEYLLVEEGTPCPILLFGSNDPCVVIGRNQNPWQECALEFMRSKGIQLARRISGGGAVFHDLGNLNYSFITAKDSYNEQECHAVVMRALADLGLNPELRNKNSIFVEGKKISGTAFCYKRDKVAHHGTVLIDADLETLRASLCPSQLDIETHAVASIPSPVANLKDFNPTLTREVVAEAIKSRFAEYSKRQIAIADAEEMADSNAAGKLRTRLAGQEWCLGNTPRFTVRIPRSDGIEIVLQVAHGRVCAADGDKSSIYCGRLFGELMVDIRGENQRQGSDINHELDKLNGGRRCL